MVRYVMVIAGLVMIAGALVIMLVISLKGIGESEKPVVRLRMHLAWISLALLLGVLIFLVWAIMRLLRYKFLPGRMPKTGEYPDAWEAAGKRFELEGDEKNGQEDDRWRED